MDDLKDDFHVRAVNLYGYGNTPRWPSDAPQFLDDQARLVETALPTNADTVCLVGHSFGGSVAMKLAARLSGRVTKLVLLETNPFYLLEQSGRADAFAEAMDLRNCVKKFGSLGEWATAAEQFADYWGGAGSWQNMSAERRNAFVEALKPNYFEWDAVTDETTPVEQWARLLPRSTLLVSDPNTVLPIREITAILRRACPMWTYKEIAGGGHMAPLTRPDLVNPLVGSFLRLHQGNHRASQPKVLGHLARLAAWARRWPRLTLPKRNSGGRDVAAQCVVYRRVGRRARRQAARPPYLRRTGRPVSRPLGQGGGACGPLLSSCGTAASGSLVEPGIQCGYHGLVFDTIGRCVAIPGQKLIPQDAQVRSYQTVEKDQLVWVWMGDPALADPTKIVDFPYHNDPAHWPDKHAVYPITGNYMLMASTPVCRRPTRRAAE